MKITDSATTRLFVYGSLAPGGSMAAMLEAIGGSWQAATVRGRLFPDGIGPVTGYPVVELDPDGEVVAGFLFSSRRLEKHWCRLDEYEGEGYRREITDVLLADGSIEPANIYTRDPSADRGSL